MRNRSFDVHSKRVRFNDAMTIYAQILKQPVENVRSFLYDVRSLEGKLPDGTFESLTPEQDAILDGFSDATMAAYTKNLSHIVRSRIQDNQKVTDTGRATRVFHTFGYQCDAREELHECRLQAIALTLEKLIPGYTPRARSLRATSTPSGGQPGYRL